MGKQSPDHKENENTMRKYLLLISLGVVFAAPKPQEFADSSEVELIPPFDAGDADQGSNPVVIVVKPTSFGDVFAGFPGFGRFPGFNSFPKFGGAAGGFPSSPEVSLDDIFGGDHEEPLLPSSNNCGLLCKVFKTLEGSLGVFDDGEGNIRTSLHGDGHEAGDYDNHNVTYSEKVLPDGSILRINKTVIQDTDENGNGFFFQSSVHHVFMDGEEEDEEIAGDVVVNDNEDPDMETVDEAIDETIVDIINDPDKVTVLDTIDTQEDPKFNEIDV